MPRATAAIVVSTVAEACAKVRHRFSAYRECEAQVGKAEKREADAIRIAGNARTAREVARLELAKALAEAHRAMGIKQGDRSGRWAKFLAEEGIATETARRWIEELGSYEAATSPNPESWGKYDGDPAEQPDPPRKAFGQILDLPLYLGRWEDVLSDVGQVDALITDGPFSKRTHESSRGMGNERADGSDLDGLAPNFEHWTGEDVTSFVEAWSPRVRGWMACMCDHELIPAYQHAYERMGRYSFAPVPCVIRGMTVRLCGDGPSSEAVYLMVARPATGEFAHWGTLPGAYHGPAERGAKHGRGKPRWLLDAIVRDYSRGNDLVCDPLAGYGVTLLSALLQRRRAIGAEMDEASVEEAFRRAKENQEPVTSGEAAQPEGNQTP
jgi:hypothetical protein